MAERRAFLVTLRRLAESYGRLPDSLVIAENIEVEDNVFASGGFADIRRGRYKGGLVAVKTLRVGEGSDVLKIKRVGTNEIFSTT